MRAEAEMAEGKPLVSGLLVLGDCDEIWIRKTLASLLGQAWPHVEVCAVSNGSTRPHVAKTLAAQASRHKNLSVANLPEPVSTGNALRRAAEMATGDLLMVVDPGDLLAPQALYEVARRSREWSRAPCCWYADEDVVDAVDRRHPGPPAKHEVTPTGLLAGSGPGRPFLFPRAAAEACGGLGGEGSAAPELDLALRLSESGVEFVRVGGIQYHRRRAPGLPRTEHGQEAVRVAIEEALTRRGGRSRVGPGLEPGTFRVRPIRRDPRVTAIVRASDRQRAGRVIRDLTKKSLIIPAEIFVTARPGDRHGARGAPVIAHTSPAVAANQAAGRATGEILLFIDASAQPARGTGSAWLRELAALALGEEAGVVAPTLVDHEDRVLHGGHGLGIEGVGLRSSAAPGVRHHLGETLGAPLDCIALAQAAFKDAGGFDAEHLPTAFFDLDLCFRLGEMGRPTIHTPFATFAVVRSAQVPGSDEVAYMWSTWGDHLRAVESSGEEHGERAVLDTLRSLA
jgi:hypothetical protein